MPDNPLELDLEAMLEATRTELEAELGAGRAHYEPAKVNPPGVWIDFRGISIRDLGGAPWYELELVLAVPSSDAKTVARRLSDLWNTVTGLYGKPDGTIRTQTTVFPDGPNGRPSLVLPYLARL